MFSPLPVVKKKVALFAQVCFFNLACLCMCAAIWELAWKPARQLLCWRRRLCGDDCSWEWQMEWRALQLQSALRLQEGNRWEQHRGKKRRGEFSATETVDKDDWEKRWGGREQQDVNWKKRKRLQRVRNVRSEVRGSKGSDWRRQRQNEDVQLTALCCQLFSFKSCTAFKIESQNRKVMKSSWDCVFLCKAARKCCTPSLSKHRDWQCTYLQVILNILTVSCFILHTSVCGARD